MSAKGAEYKSQGQAPNNVRRVAPGTETNEDEALKERKTDVGISHFQCSVQIVSSLPGATRSAALHACPWLLYFAPSALPFSNIFINLSLALRLCTNTNYERQRRGI